MPSNHLPPWIADAVLYQIYPASFNDSNGDGMGDIPGIIDKLDYLSDLGITALWLCPCFESPFRDGGYDVTDYRKVAARYGTNADLKALFDTAHQRGLKVILDLVAGHTSIEHPWFQASCEPSPNAYSDYYIWTNSGWELPPAPYRAVNGYADRAGAFLINFFWSQPALNYGFADPDPGKPWQQPIDAPGPQAVRRELRDIMAFWLDMGCDGFRVDMAESLIRGNDQKKRIDAITDLWREIHQWVADNYPEAALISEWSFPKEAIPSGFHVDFMIHFRTPAYTSLLRLDDERAFKNFPRAPSYFNPEGRGDIRIWLDTFLEHWEQTRQNGFISLPSGNHDLAPRLGDTRSVEELKVIYTFLLTLPHVPTLYYGDEVGMRGNYSLTSKEGAFDRVGVRTPMQWNRGLNAGFSSAPASDLYLPCEPPERCRNVEDALADNESLLHHIRALIKLRRANPALGSRGHFSPLSTDDRGYPFAYIRSDGQRKFLVAINPTRNGQEATLTLEEAKLCDTIFASDAVKIHRKEPNTIHIKLPPFAWVITQLN